MTSFMYKELILANHRLVVLRFNSNKKNKSFDFFLEQKF